MTTGEVLRVRAAMKPISTVPRALDTVDVATGEPAKAINQRSDVCAVPAAAVVAEAMVALVLSNAVLEKFGGDSVGETARNVAAYLEHLTHPVTANRDEPRVSGPRAVLVGPPGREVDGRSSCWPIGWGVAFRDTDRDIEQAAGMTVADIFVTAARSTSALWSGRPWRRRSPSTRASWRWAAARSSSRAGRATAGRTHVVVHLDVAPGRCDAAARR